jgi:hypothetical protein
MAVTGRSYRDRHFKHKAMPDNQAAQNPFYNECLIFEILSILKHPA